MKGNLEEAETWLSWAWKRGYHSHPVANNLAILYGNQGKEKEALQIIQEGMKKKVTPESLNTYANLLRKSGKSKEAAKIYLKCIRQFPHFYPTYYNLGELYLLEGELDKAEEVYGKLLESPSKKLKALGYEGLGKVYYFEEKWDKALKVLKKGLDLDKQNILLQYYGFTLGKLGKWREGLLALEEIKNPREEVLYNKALFLIELNEGKKARKILSSFSKDSPYYESSQLAMAHSYEREGNFFSALEIYENLLKKNPNNSQAYHNLALIYLGGDELQKALQYFSKAIQLSPMEPLYYKNRGILYLKLGKKGKAAQDFKQYFQLASPPKEEEKQLLELINQIK